MSVQNKLLGKVNPLDLQVKSEPVDVTPAFVPSNISMTTAINSLPSYYDEFPVTNEIDTAYRPMPRITSYSPNMGNLFFIFNFFFYSSRSNVHIHLILTFELVYL